MLSKDTLGINQSHECNFEHHEGFQGNKHVLKVMSHGCNWMYSFWISHRTLSFDMERHSSDDLRHQVARPHQDGFAHFLRKDQEL